MEEHGSVSDGAKEMGSQATLAFGALGPCLGGLRIIGEELDDAGEPPPSFVDLGFADVVLLLVHSSVPRACIAGGCRLNEGDRQRREKQRRERWSQVGSGWLAGMACNAICASLLRVPPPLGASGQCTAAPRAGCLVAQADELGSHGLKNLAARRALPVLR